MKLAQILLVGLALWMPTAAFVSAASSDRTEVAAPGESAESQPDQSELLLSKPAPQPSAVEFANIRDCDGHRPLAGHLVEPLIPPPNPTPASAA